jgi:serine/threonine protein kinase
MATAEQSYLKSLSDEGCQNCPTIVDYYQPTEPLFAALVISPIGVSVLPLYTGAEITPSMLQSLVGAVEMAHRRGIIHRDIKPDNIYLDKGNTGRIILNWSSAALVGVRCRWVGTRKCADQTDDDGTYTLCRESDLRSLMRTVHCLLKQKLPQCDDSKAKEYWDKVESNYPCFRRGMELAIEVNYEDMKKLVINIL